MHKKDALQIRNRLDGVIFTQVKESAVLIDFFENTKIADAGNRGPHQPTHNKDADKAHGYFRKRYIHTQDGANINPVRQVIEKQDAASFPRMDMR